MCGVGKWLQRWKEQSHSKCPRCLKDDKTVHHVVHCLHPDATLLWSTGIEDIEKWISANDGIPGLADIIAGRLLQWRGHTCVTVFQDDSDKLQAALAQHDEIGWDTFFFGTVVFQWRSVQEEY